MRWLEMRVVVADNSAFEISISKDIKEHRN